MSSHLSCKDNSGRHLCNTLSISTKWISAAHRLISWNRRSLCGTVKLFLMNCQVYHHLIKNFDHQIFTPDVNYKSLHLFPLQTIQIVVQWQPLTTQAVSPDPRNGTECVWLHVVVVQQYYTGMRYGSHFIRGLSIVIQIGWTIRVTITHILIRRWLQNFARVTIAVLSWNVQNCSDRVELQQNELSIEFDNVRNTISQMGPW